MAKEINMNIKKCNYKLTNLYYGLVFSGYVLTLVINGFRSGVFAALLMTLIAAITLIIVIKSDKKSDFISLINVCVFAYLLYNFFSFIWIMKNGFPLSVYVEEFSNSVLPVVFYFVPALIIKTEADDIEKEKITDSIYKAFIVAFTVFSIISIILYITAPQFYCDYLFNMSFISKADASTCRVRMESFTGSTSISYLGVAAMLVSARFMYKYASLLSVNKTNDKNKNNGDTLKQFIIYSALFVFSLIVVFLANGRAGMVAALLVIVYINILVFSVFRFADRKYLYIEAGAIIALIVILCIITPSIVSKIWARLVSLPGAIGQRSEQWVSAINNMYGQWFGNGLGANGHKAIGIEGAKVVADGGLVKLYCEEGALGFSLFAFIILVIVRQSFKDLKKYFSELGIIMTALLMSIGSNIIAFQLCMPIFYFALGVIGADVNGNAKEKKELKEENKCG